MTDETVLDVLIAVTFVIASLLALFSSASMGRAIASLELQIERAIHGVPRMQSWINIRIHFNRLILALTFLSTAILVLTNIDPLIRTWVSRVLSLTVLFAFTGSEILDWIAGRRQLHLLVRDQTTELERQRQITDEALARAERAEQIVREEAPHAAEHLLEPVDRDHPAGVGERTPISPG